MGISILLVDDHTEFRKALRRFLEAQDVSVVGEALTGADAVQLTESLRPDLVIIDLGLPDVQEMELVTKLHRSEGWPKVIVMSVRLDKARTGKAFEAGADGVVLKDRVMEELMPAILEVANHRRHPPVWVPD